MWSPYFSHPARMYPFATQPFTPVDPFARGYCHPWAYSGMQPYYYAQGSPFPSFAQAQRGAHPGVPPLQAPEAEDVEKNEESFLVDPCVSGSDEEDPGVDVDACVSPLCPGVVETPQLQEKPEVSPLPPKHNRRRRRRNRRRADKCGAPHPQSQAEVNVEEDMRGHIDTGIDDESEEDSQTSDTGAEVPSWAPQEMNSSDSAQHTPQGAGGDACDDARDAPFEKSGAEQVNGACEACHSLCTTAGGCSLSLDDAALLIQAAWVGYQVRRVKPLDTLKVLVDLERCCEHAESEVEKALKARGLPHKEKVALSEGVMTLLLSMDALSCPPSLPSLRQRRKDLARVLTRLQDRADSIPISPDTPKVVPSKVHDPTTTGAHNPSRTAPQESVHVRPRQSHTIPDPPHTAKGPETPHLQGRQEWKEQQPAKLNTTHVPGDYSNRGGYQREKMPREGMTRNAWPHHYGASVASPFDDVEDFFSGGWAPTRGRSPYYPWINVAGF